MLSESLKGLGWVVSVILSIVLAIIAMAWLVSRYSILQSEAMSLGLWVFFFIMFLDIFAIILLIGLESRPGDGKTAMKLAGGFLLVGFLAASIMGSLTSLMIAAIAKPWGLLLLLGLLLPSFVSGTYKTWVWLRKYRMLREPRR